LTNSIISEQCYYPFTAIAEISTKAFKGKFDTSTDAIVALTSAGVNEDVISLMMEKK